jgi:hypothetical protein
MTDLIVGLKANGRVLIGSDLTDPTTMDYVTGQTGVIAQILVANYERADKQCRINRNRLLGTATATGVAAFRAQEGRLPESLDELTDAGIPIIEDAEVLEALDYETTGDTAVLKVRVQDRSSDIPLTYATEWEHPWMTGNKEFVIFNFGPLEN